MVETSIKVRTTMCQQQVYSPILLQTNVVSCCTEMCHIYNTTCGFSVVIIYVVVVTVALFSWGWLVIVTVVYTSVTRC